MRLQSIYIQNFGKLSGFELKFNEGLTSICEDNGFGKTTIAQFIKAMFYSMPSYKSNSKDFATRKRYLPFNGNTYGGTLVFEEDGHTYRIERSFGDASDKGDTFKLYKDDTLSNDFSDNIGFELFGIDADSFEKTVFLNSSNLNTIISDGIKESLSKELGELDDSCDVGGALDTLKDAKKKTSNKMKELKASITEITSKIKELNNKQDNLPQKYKLLEEYKLKLAEYDELLKSASEANMKYQAYQDYLKKLENIESLKVQLKDYQETYPTSSEFEEMKGKNGEASFLKKGLEDNPLPDEASMKEVFEFNESCCDEATLEAIKANISEYERLTNELKLKEQSNNQELIDRYHMILESDILKLEEDMNDYLTFKQTYEELDDSIMSSGKPNKKKLILPIVCISISFIVMILGIVLISSNPTLGIILAFVGLFMTLGSTGYLFYMIKSTKPALVINPEKQKVKMNLDLKGNSLYMYLRHCFDKVTQDNVEFYYAKLMEEYPMYLSLKDSMNTSSELKNQIDALKKILDEFFKSYQIEESTYNLAYSELTTKISLYQKKDEDYRKSKDAYLKTVDRIKELEEELSLFYKKYHQKDSVSLILWQEEANRFERLKQQIKVFEAEAEAYKESHQMENEKPIAIDVEDLNHSRNEINQKISKEGDRIDEIETELVQLDALENSLFDKQEELKELKDKLEVIEATIGFISSTQEEMNKKYVKPIKTCFEAYADIVRKNLGFEMVIDSSFNLSYEQDGKIHDIHHLSAGEFACAALCYRLALCDVIFEGKKHLMILDDIFAELDKDYLSKFKLLVKELAKTQDIIYFTCHESRQIS